MWVISKYFSSLSFLELKLGQTFGANQHKTSTELDDTTLCPIELVFVVFSETIMGFGFELWFPEEKDENNRHNLVDKHKIIYVPIRIVMIK